MLYEYKHIMLYAYKQIMPYEYKHIALFVYKPILANSLKNRLISGFFLPYPFIRAPAY